MLPMKWVLLSMMVTIMVLASCQPNAITSQPTILPQPLATPSLFAFPSVSATVSPTPQIKYPRPLVPTISLTTQLKIFELLNTIDCILPCYLGITPGVTKWSDAKNLLDSSGSVYLEPSQKRGDVTWFHYAMDRDYSITGLNQEADSLFDFHLAVDNNGIVQQMFAWFVTHDAGHILSQYWAKNSPRNIFLQIGIPDEIYSYRAGLALVYKKLGVVGVYDALWDGSLLCPENQTRLSDMSFMFTNTAFPLDIYPLNASLTS
jgi:hypothetical protein